MDLYRTHLEPMDNYSEFCREAIIEKLERMADPIIIDARIKGHKQKIQELQVLKKSSMEDSEQVKELLEIGYNQFKILDEKQGINPHSFKLYLRSNILPKLAKARCNRFDENSLLDMYQKGDINV